MFSCNKKYKDIYYNNSLTSCHYQIEKRLKRKTNEQIQHWLLLLKISHDIMWSCYQQWNIYTLLSIYIVIVELKDIYTYNTVLHNYIKYKYTDIHIDIYIDLSAMLKCLCNSLEILYVMYCVKYLISYVILLIIISHYDLYYWTIEEISM